MRSFIYISVFALVLFVVAAAQAQTPPTPSVPTVPPVPRTVRVAPPVPIFPGQRTDTELRVDAEQSVNLKFCISEGELKVNGWDRNEVRILVRSGRKFGIRVLERAPASGNATWIWATPTAIEGQTAAQRGECLSGDSVEMDVPHGATLNFHGRSATTSVDSVRKVSLKIVEGNISLRNITGGISASALQGDLIVTNSSGSLSLDSTTGNIIVYGLEPIESSDLLKVKTNSGSIMLQRVGHRQIEANSITGSLQFEGGFLAGGIYNFKTSNGTLRMLVPENGNCTVSAAYGFGSFNAAIPVETITENITPGGKNVVAKIGTGEACNVTLTTSSGRIQIVRLEP
ncbi:MAG: DUF4097 family beta strand repeat protein [Acidobacteria bacterium]|nr:DUF4097 family beta strand repeat protein [Acidobacteriota bacterium]